ncbi:MAG TPA: hypothetical protein VKR53_05595 [Puia sp.]|nr:hypothetical protein [Puia sp.]
MKNQLLCFYLLSFTLASGQQLQKIRKVVPILSQQTIALNGGIRSNFGGQSREYVEIQLPPNTVEWYYLVTTAPIQNKALALVEQLTRLIDPSGLSSLAESAIISPTGTNVCDTYLMDRNNTDAFQRKADLNKGNYSFIISGSRTNFRGGPVQVRDIKTGTWFLGFRNPSETQALAITFEVAAVVEETIVNNTLWSAENKQKFYQQYFDFFKNKYSDDGLAKNLSSCLTDKIIRTRSLQEYIGMSTYEKDELIKSLFRDCKATYLPVQTDEQQKASEYGSLGWKAYESGDVDGCMEYSKKALSHDPSLCWVKLNLGLCYLIKKQEGTAMDYYVDAITDMRKLPIKTEREHHLHAAIDDINNALTKYPDMKQTDYIKQLFEDELKK